MSCPAGQTRNRSTGRCRKPCERHQAINPATGRCVSKNYLNKIRRQPSGPCDNVYAPYGRGSAKDFRDGMVPDPACWPRMRNVYTGYCKTPCGPGRAINPATGNCVTLRYLKMLHPNDYDTDDDDEMVAPILFTPTSITANGQYANEVSKLSGFKTNLLTENDIAVMKGVYQAANDNVGGAYSPDARKENCKESAFSMADQGPFSLCGLSAVTTKTTYETKDGGYFAELVMANTDLSKNIFVFMTAVSSKTIPEGMLDAANAVASKAPVRMLIPNYYGVWRLLIPMVNAENKDKLDTSIRVVKDAMRHYSRSMGHISSAKIANEVHEAVKSRNDLHLSFAPYPEDK